MTTVQQSAIAAHGRKLLAIFPRATERDPIALCKKLRRLEAQGAALALRFCNGPEFPTPETADAIGAAIIIKVNALLGNIPRSALVNGRLRNNIPVFLNRDPRGYALKIDDGWMRLNNCTLHSDWGGYGILAPEIGKDGQ